jgi:hypothetical protein
MIDVVMEPCTAVFTGPTGCGKTKLVLDLLSCEYRGFFEYIVVLCPTIWWNRTYLDRRFLWVDCGVFMIDPGEKLFEYVGKISGMLAGCQVLFVVDDVIANEVLDKKRQPLLELAVSGRHRQHSLWLLTQSYTAIPKNLRRQKKMVFMFYPNERSDLKLIDEETNLIDDWDEIKKKLKKDKHSCLYIRLDHPRTYSIC